MANLITQVTPLGSATNYGVRASAMQYGTCSTGASTTSKTVTCASFTSNYLTEGSIIAVKFTNTNTGAVGSLTLNVNGTGAKPIKTLISGVISNLPSANCLQANCIYKFMYDGTNWICDMGFSLVDDTMVFKGVVGTGTGMISLPTTPREAGWVYRIGTAGTYAGATCEVGDMIVCVKDVASGGTTANSDFAIIQANVNGPLYKGNNSLTDNAFLVADGTAGQVKSITLTEQTIQTVSSFSGGSAASLTTSTYTITPFGSGGTNPSLTTSTYTINNPTVTSGSAASLTTSTYTINNPTVTGGSAASLTTSTYTINNPTITAGSSASLTTSTYTIPNITSVGSAPTLGTAIPADDITSWSAGTMFTATVSGEVLTFTAGTAPTLSYTAKSIPNVTSVGSAPTLGTAFTIKGVNAFTQNTPTAISTTSVTIKGVNTFTANTPTSVSTSSITIKGVNAFIQNTPTAVSTTSVTIKGVNVWSAGSAATAGTAVTIKGVNTFTPNTIASLTTSTVTVATGAGNYDSLSYASGVSF